MTILRDLPQKARPFALMALNALLPPQCLRCQIIVPQHGALCTTCWDEVHFITDPFCGRCGLPFPHAMGEGAFCGECTRSPPAYGMARAVFRYDTAGRELVVPFKFHDATHPAPVFAAWLARAGEPFLGATDLIVPVPLHYWRFVKRRYNQAALLAAQLARRTGIRLVADALTRIRPTPAQASLDLSHRQANVKNAFTVTVRHKAILRGKTVVLVDDVLTTGATADACAKTLLAGGAAAVNVLALARTTREM